MHYLIRKEEKAKGSIVLKNDKTTGINPVKINFHFTGFIPYVRYIYVQIHYLHVADHLVTHAKDGFYRHVHFINILINKKYHDQVSHCGRISGRVRYCCIHHCIADDRFLFEQK